MVRKHSFIACPAECWPHAEVAASLPANFTQASGDSVLHVSRGFKMLAAMGYQQGQGLGKAQAGRAAPIPVQLKAGRHGLGVDENKKRKQQQVEVEQQNRGAQDSALTNLTVTST